MNACGHCTMCCKTRGVNDYGRTDDPVQNIKPEYVWCPDCEIGQGCRQYEFRPRSCAEYQCAWLETQAGPLALRLPPEMRPDRSKVVIECAPDGRSYTMFVDPDRRDAWRSPSIQRLIAVIQDSGRLAAVITRGDEILYATPGTVVLDDPAEAALHREAQARRYVAGDNEQTAAVGDEDRSD